VIETQLKLTVGFMLTVDGAMLFSLIVAWKQI